LITGNLGISEAQVLDDYPHISAADLINAWAYGDAHPEEIEEAIIKQKRINQNV
jgi:uncharacterized protein (DUF433 family)